MFNFNLRNKQHSFFDNAEVSLDLLLNCKHSFRGMMARSLQLSSGLKDLKPTHLSKLSQILDPENAWRDFAAKIKRRNGTDMFNIDQINMLESVILRSGRSPTQEIITSWCTANPKIEDLRSVLDSINNKRAVLYIDNYVINGQENQIPQHEASEVTTEYGDYDDIYKPCKTDNSTCTVQQEQSTKVQNPHSVKHERFLYSFLQQVTDDFNSMPLSKGGRLIGEGGFGKVFKGSHPDYPDMAVKKFNDAYLDDASFVERQFITELEVLSCCQHENILSLIGYCIENKDRLCVVSEYMVNGSLEDRLACKDGTPSLKVSVRLSIIRGVARGLEYLHKLNPPLIHRDIKTANILLDEKFTAKIGDCGTVRTGPDGTKTSTRTVTPIGTCPYMPKEYREDNEVSAKTDAYSFGVVLLEVLTGLPVVDDDRENKFLPTYIYEKIAEDYDEDDDDGILNLLDRKAGYWGQVLPKNIYRLYKKMTEHKKKRLTVIEALPEIERWEQPLDGDSV